MAFFNKTYSPHTDISNIHVGDTWLAAFYLSLLANTVDPDQTAHYVASDPGLPCLAMALLWVSR